MIIKTSWKQCENWKVGGLSPGLDWSHAECPAEVSDV